MSKAAPRQFWRIRPPTPAAALAALETMLETVVDVIVGPPEMRRVARFIIREQMQPTAAFEILFGTFTRLHTVACRLLAAAAGLEPEAKETRIRVFLLIGQAIFLRIGEAAVLRRMEIARYDAEFLAKVKALLKQNLRAIVAAAREGGQMTLRRRRSSPPAAATSSGRVVSRLASPPLLCRVRRESERASFQGYVEGEFVEVAPEVGGRIVELAVRRGDEVEARRAALPHRRRGGR